MTTYEEISQDAAANREFWSEHCRLSLSFYREHRFTRSDVAARYRAGFRKQMHDRRAMTYFEGRP